MKETTFWPECRGFVYADTDAIMMNGKECRACGCKCIEALGVVGAGCDVDCRHVDARERRK